MGRARRSVASDMDAECCRRPTRSATAGGWRSVRSVARAGPACDRLGAHKPEGGGRACTARGAHRYPAHARGARRRGPGLFCRPSGPRGRPRRALRRRPASGSTRAGHEAVVRFRTRAAGEALVDITASAPGISWGIAGSESAVLRLVVDGVFVGDDVVMASTPVTRSFDLGALPPGRHELRLQFDAAASAPSAKVVRVGAHPLPHRRRGHARRTSPCRTRRSCTAATVRATTVATGPYQNAVTDTPLVAWHEDTAARDAGPPASCSTRSCGATRTVVLRRPR